MKVAEVRCYALSLPDTTEEPHFEYSSFRVRGKIFVTVPPDKEHIHCSSATKSASEHSPFTQSFSRDSSGVGKYAGSELACPKRHRASSTN